MEMQGGVLVARKERGGFGLATFATGIVYGLQVGADWCSLPGTAQPGASGRIVARRSKQQDA